MFSERAIDIALRKERLLARCEEQRAAIERLCGRWREPARILDSGWAVATFLRAHPAVVAVVVAVGVVLGRKNLVRWAGRGMIAWRAWHALARWLRRASA